MGPRPDPDVIYSWQAAEQAAQTWMRDWGYRDARLTASGADGGIDVHSSGAVAQVKYEVSKTGAPALQRLFGARGPDRARQMLFFSMAGFSRPAVDYADSVGIALFHYGADGRVRAVNDSARRVSGDRLRALRTDSAGLLTLLAPSRPSSRTTRAKTTTKGGSFVGFLIALASAAFFGNLWLKGALRVENYQSVGAIIIGLLLLGCFATSLIAVYGLIKEFLAWSGRSTPPVASTEVATAGAANTEPPDRQTA